MNKAVILYNESPEIEAIYIVCDERVQDAVELAKQVVTKDVQLLIDDTPEVIEWVQRPAGRGATHLEACRDWGYVIEVRTVDAELTDVALDVAAQREALDIAGQRVIGFNRFRAAVIDRVNDERGFRDLEPDKLSQDVRDVLSAAFEVLA